MTEKWSFSTVEQAVCGCVSAFHCNCHFVLGVAHVASLAPGKVNELCFLWSAWLQRAEPYLGEGSSLGNLEPSALIVSQWLARRHHQQICNTVMSVWQASQPLLSPTHGERLKRAGKPKIVNCKQDSVGERASGMLPSLNTHKPQGCRGRLLT